jgi:hypothetical protein
MALLEPTMPTQKCACSFVERLSRHVHPRDGRKAFCMLEAYMDESGIHDGAHVCVVAGYWGSMKKQSRFESRWKEIIKGANEPSLKEFHSTDFWYSDGRRKGVFAKWSDAKADQFISDLANCVVESRIFPTAATLVTAEWEKLNKNERMLLTGGYYDIASEKWKHEGAPNKRYFLPFQFAVVHPAIHCSPGLNVHYVFDLNKQFKQHALDLFALLKKDPNMQCRHRIGSLDFDVGEEAVGLQAADLFAYQNYQSSKLRIARGKPFKQSELPALLRTLATNARSDNDFPFFDQEGLNVALQKMPTHLRSAGWTPVTPKADRCLG